MHSGTHVQDFITNNIYKMRLLTLLFAIFWLSNLGANNREGKSLIIEKLKNQIDKNKSLNAEGNRIDQEFMIYLNPEVPEANSALEAFTMTGGDYLKEKPQGIFPELESYGELLTKYNNMTSSLTDSKVQHYVCVVDIAPSIYGEYQNYLGHSNSTAMAYLKEYDYYDYSYNSFFEGALEDKFNTTDYNDFFSVELSNDYYISIFVVNRKVKKGYISTSVNAKHAYDLTNVDFKDKITNDLYPKLEFVKNNNGFNYIKEYIKKFINVFHGDLPDDLTCSTAIDHLNLNSGIAADFVNEMCTLFPDFNDNSAKSYAIYRSAQVIDYISVFHTTIGASSGDPSDPVPIKNYAVGKLSAYINSFDGTTYPIWLDNDTPTVMGRMKEVYHSVFYDLEATNGDEMLSKIQEDFDFFFSFAAEFKLWADLLVGGFCVDCPRTGPEKMNSDFKDACDQAFESGLYTEANRIQLNGLITSNPDILYNFYLDPAAPGVPFYGYTATEVAESTSLFLQKFDGSYSSFAWNETQIIEGVDTDNLVDIPTKKVFIGSANNFNNASGCGGKILIRAKTPQYNSSNSEITFGLQRCKKYEWQYTSGGYSTVGTSSCQCTSMIDALPDVTAGFYEIVYTVSIKNVTYFINCANCDNTLVREHAFVPLTRMREDNVNHNIGLAMLALEIATIPFSGAALLTARGAYLVFRGIVFAIEVEAVIIGIAGGGDFTQGCKNVFGDERGAAIAPYLNILNLVTAGADIGQSIGAAALNRWELNQLKKASAAAGYMADVNRFGGDIDAAEQLSSLRKQLGLGQDIDDLQDYLKFYGLESLPELQESAQYKRLIAAYRYQHGITNNASDTYQAIDQLLIDGLPAQAKTRLIDNMNGPNASELVDELTDVADMTKTERKVRAYRRLIEVTDVCN